MRYAALQKIRLYPRAALGALALGCVFLAIHALTTGALGLSAGDVFAALGGGEADEITRATVLEIRLPRLLLALTCGAALAVSGAALQGIFRNGLADPGLIGVSSGAALGAVLGIAFGIAAVPALNGVAGTFAIAGAAFTGALGTTMLTLRLATRGGQTSVVTLLLAGIAINAGCFAAIGYFIYAADNTQLRNITLWTLGSLGGATPETAVVAVVTTVACSLIIWRFAAQLDLMLLGEAEAFHLGTDVETLKRTVVVASALMVGACVAFSGLIGFIGLVTPHIARLLIGPSHRTLLPASALLGAGLLVVADTIARTAAAPAELPIGVLTAAVGAPFFLGLLLAGRHQGAA